MDFHPCYYLQQKALKTGAKPWWSGIRKLECRLLTFCKILASIADKEYELATNNNSTERLYKRSCVMGTRRAMVRVDCFLSWSWWKSDFTRMAQTRWGMVGFYKFFYTRKDWADTLDCIARIAKRLKYEHWHTKKRGGNQAWVDSARARGMVAHYQDISREFKNQACLPHLVGFLQLATSWATMGQSWSVSCRATSGLLPR